MAKESWNIELNIVPDLVKGRITQGQGSTPPQGLASETLEQEQLQSHVGVCEVSIPCEAKVPSAKTDIEQRLELNPFELYRILQGETTSWLEEWLPADSGFIWGTPECSCHKDKRSSGDARAVCEHMEAVLHQVQRRLQEEPLLRLQLLGLSREILLAGVFGGWAQLVPAHAGKEASEDAARLEEKSKSGPSAGEWLAEAADQGKLHEPGPAFNDVITRLQPQGVTNLEFPFDDWSAFLVDLKAVDVVFRDITSRTAKRAEERLKNMSHHDLEH